MQFDVLWPLHIGVVEYREKALNSAQLESIEIDLIK